MLRWTMVFLGLAAIGGPVFAQDGPFGSSVTVVGTSVKPGAVVYDLQWPARRAKWKTVSAWLVVPTAPQGPGIVFFHQLGQQRDRGQFLPEALLWAEKGVSSLLINGHAPWEEGWKGTPEDAEMIDAQLAEVEDAVGVLSRVPGSDPSRFAFVGHDYGAMFGALLYPKSSLFSAYVFIAPAAEFADWIFYANREAAQDKPRYTRGLGGRDPLVALDGPARFPLLFQYANNDGFVSAANAQKLTQVAQGAVVKNYTASHNSVADKGREDRRQWLLPLLGL